MKNKTSKKTVNNEPTLDNQASQSDKETDKPKRRKQAREAEQPTTTTENGELSYTFCSNNINIIDLTETAVTKKRTTKAKSYVPVYRSGGWALLVALLECSRRDDYVGHVSKNKLIEAATPFCDSSFTQVRVICYRLLSHVFLIFSLLNFLIPLGLVWLLY
jgi:hypothetical protein